jgi:hypothetical protein
MASEKYVQVIGVCPAISPASILEINDSDIVGFVKDNIGTFGILVEEVHRIQLCECRSNLNNPTPFGRVLGIKMASEITARVITNEECFATTLSADYTTDLRDPSRTRELFVVA